jgi:hypothetical protein
MSHTVADVAAAVDRELFHREVSTRRERREKIRREAMREALNEPSLNAVHAGSEYLKGEVLGQRR